MPSRRPSDHPPREASSGEGQRAGATAQVRVARQPALDDAPALRDATRELLTTFTKGVLAEEFPARPGSVCENCALSRCCPAQACGEQVMS